MNYCKQSLIISPLYEILRTTQTQTKIRENTSVWEEKFAQLLWYFNRTLKYMIAQYISQQLNEISWLDNSMVLKLLGSKLVLLQTRRTKIYWQDLFLKWVRISQNKQGFKQIEDVLHLSPMYFAMALRHNHSQQQSVYLLCIYQFPTQQQNKETLIIKEMDNNKKDTGSDGQQSFSSLQSLLQSKEQLLRKKRVATQLYAEISSFSRKKESEKIVYFDEQFQEVELLLPNRDATSSNSQNSEKYANATNLQHIKTPKQGKTITKSSLKSRKSSKKSCKFPYKNQYDKNIFSNITKVMINKIFNKNCQNWVNKYCILYDVNYAEFIATLKDLNLQKIRIGTSELKRILFNPSVEPSVQRVFSSFMVDFLQGDFVGYILQEGKMIEPEKYLKCASKMMYIPQLRREDYFAIASLQSGQLSS